MRATIDSAVPPAAAAKVTQLVSEIDSRAIGSPLLAPNVPAALAPSVIFATDAQGKILLAALGTSAAVSLSANSTALALARTLIDSSPDKTAEADIQSALRASANYAALVSTVSQELAAGRSPGDSTGVAAAALRVVGDVAVRLGLGTAIAASAAADMHPLAASGGVLTVRGPMPFPLVDYAPFCTNKAAPCWSRLLLAGGDENGVTVQNGMPIAWALRTETPTSARIEEAVISGSEDVLPQREAMQIKEMKGNGVRFNLRVYQNETTLGQNAEAVVIDIFKIGLQSLGVWGSKSYQCLLPVADIVLTETGIVRGLANGSANNGTDTALYDYFTEQKFTELGEPLKKAAECMGASFESRALARFLLSRTFWGKTVLRAMPILGQAYLITQGAGALATTVIRAYVFWQEASTDKTFQICEAPNAGIVNCPVRYELASSTRNVGEQFLPTVKAFDADDVVTLPPMGLQWSSDNAIVVAALDKNGPLKAMAEGSTLVQVLDPFLAGGLARAMVTVQLIRPVVTVTVTGNVKTSTDCTGAFVGPRFTNGVIDPGGILDNLPFTLKFTVDPARGFVYTTPTYSGISDVANVPLSLTTSPVTGAALLIAGKTVEFTQLNASYLSGGAAVSRDIASGSVIAGYVSYAFGVGGGANDGSRVVISVLDNAFLTIFASRVDFTLPYSYTFSSPQASQNGNFVINNKSSNNNGCGSLSAQGELNIQQITVTR